MVAPRRNSEPIPTSSTLDQAVPLWRRRGTVVTGLGLAAGLALSACTPTAESQPTPEAKSNEIEQPQSEGTATESPSTPEAGPTAIPDVFPEAAMDLITHEQYQNSTPNDLSYMQTEAWEDIVNNPEISSFDHSRVLNTAHRHYYRYHISENGQLITLGPDFETGATPYEQYVDEVRGRLVIPGEAVEAFLSREDEPLQEAIESNFNDFIDIANDILRLNPNPPEPSVDAINIQTEALKDALHQEGRGVTFSEETTQFFGSLATQGMVDIMMRDNGFEDYQSRLSIVGDNQTGEPILHIHPQHESQAAGSSQGSIVLVNTVVEMVTEAPSNEDAPQTGSKRSPVRFVFNLNELQSGDYQMSIQEIAINQPGETIGMFTDREELDTEAPLF